MTAFRCAYRLMFSERFRFADARALIPYLRDLGVSHVYLPPSFQARAGSTHGYDVVDPGRISDELGGEAEFRGLCADARAAGMGVILDIVPNHMAADDANRYWADEQLRRKFFDLDEEAGRWRRFFDVDHLAGVRQEDPEVFEATHSLALELVRDGVIDGLRIDHPDGLADPAGYLQRLALAGAAHVWVEKILDPDERLRDWPVEGTVGYEFLNDVAALFVDPAAEQPLTALWDELTGERSFAEIAQEAKLEQAQTTFQPECDRLRREAGGDVYRVEFAVSALPVYRTYVREDRFEAEDRAVLEQAGVEWICSQPQRFVTRFQQTTPAVMAKGVEDTAFYRHARLVALNDVGGDPSRFGISIERFHAGNAERAERFPRNLLITQTHDTKRSGDLRARAGALSWLPDEWAELARRLVDPRLRSPDALEQYFFLQHLVAAWQIAPERLEGYVEKALREAKRNTNWIDQDHAHEDAVKQWVCALREDRALHEFSDRLAPIGDRHALGQLLLKLTVPGVPDIYQGDELESLALVDPDNRRPVDYDRRRTLLDQVRAGAAPTDETRKLWLIVRALDLRRRREEAFAGAYRPVAAGGRACAFTRGDDAVFVAVGVRPGWGETPPPLPDGDWTDVLAGGLGWERDGVALCERGVRAVSARPARA